LADPEGRDSPTFCRSRTAMMTNTPTSPPRQRLIYTVTYPTVTLNMTGPLPQE
jgi:hypothetical protein